MVLDTNVVLSGLFWNGPPRRLLAGGFRAGFTRFTSRPLLEELADVLSRLKFAERLSVSPLSIAELVDRYARSTTLVVPRPVPRLAPDPDDDVVIGTALAAKASLIVTGDRTLLEVARYQHVQIVSVQDALEAIGLR